MKVLHVIPALALAASQLTTYLTLRSDQDPGRYTEYYNHLVVRLSPKPSQQNEATTLPCSMAWRWCFSG